LSEDDIGFGEFRCALVLCGARAVHIRPGRVA
jgi:hypothetical protein